MGNYDINEIYERAGKRIKMFRKYRGITQLKLSINSTYSRGFISNIESNKTFQTFSLATLYDIAIHLDIPIELFVKEDISKELEEMGITIDKK